jgi:hypothetical protein
MESVTYEILFKRHMKEGLHWSDTNQTSSLKNSTIDPPNTKFIWEMKCVERRTATTFTLSSVYKQHRKEPVHYNDLLELPAMFLLQYNTDRIEKTRALKCHARTKIMKSSLL